MIFKQAPLDFEKVTDLIKVRVWSWGNRLGKKGCFHTQIGASTQAHVYSPLAGSKYQYKRCRQSLKLLLAVCPLFLSGLSLCW